MARPSIAMIPSAYKASKVYSVLPTNGDGDLTFTRASSATRVNENGLIEEVASNIPRLDYSDGGCPSLLLEPQSTNLITYSEDFTNGFWNKQNITVNSNSGISPKGDLTADLIIPNTSVATHQISTNPITSSSVQTMSCYAKQGGYSTFDFLDRASATNGARFDLSNGTFSIIGTTTAKIENIGNGWYRCSITANTTGIRFYVPSSSGSESGDGTSGVYIWGAQLEQQSYATSYIPTTGATATRLADSASLTTTGFGLTSITETFKDGSANVITTIPTTYNVSEGKIAKIIGE